MTNEEREIEEADRLENLRQWEIETLVKSIRRSGLSDVDLITLLNDELKRLEAGLFNKEG